MSRCVSDEREAVQKKTFTKWVNSHLSRVSCRITDLYMDLRDGRMLIKLLEVLSGEKLVGPNAPSQKAFVLNVVVFRPEGKSSDVSRKLH